MTILDRGGCRRKTTEVMVAAQKLAGSLHHIAIQRIENMVDVSFQERREDVPIINAVFVSLLEGVFLGVKVLTHSADSENSNIPGQEAIESSVKALGIPLLFESKVGHLPQRMNACIGSPGAHHCDVFCSKSSQCVRDSALDRLLILLGLPACKAAAVVLEENFIFGQWSMVNGQ